MINLYKIIAILFSLYKINEGLMKKKVRNNFFS